MSANLKDFETKVTDELDIVLHTKSSAVLNKINTPGQFQDLIKKEFNILYYLIKENKSNNKLADKLLADFNKSSNIKFEPDEKYKPNDEYQLIDDVNYLSIYIRNIFKVELMDLSKLDTKVEDIKIDETNSNNNTRSQSNSFAKMFGGAGAMATVSARMRLNQEVKEGKVYIYDSKPKIIILLKKIFLVLFTIFSVALIIDGVFMFMCNRFKVGTINDEDVFASTILNGIFYILIAIWSLYLAYKFYCEIYDKKFQNDNIKYRFNFTYLIFEIIFFVLVFLLDLFNIRYQGQVWLFSSIDLIISNNPDKATYLWGWISCEIICSILFCALAIIMVVAKVYNPKPDNQRIQELLDQYVKEMSTPTGV